MQKIEAVQEKLFFIKLIKCFLAYFLTKYRKFSILNRKQLLHSIELKKNVLFY